MDITDDSSVAGAAKEVRELDVLINNAGAIAEGDQDILTIRPELVARTKFFATVGSLVKNPRFVGSNVSVAITGVNLAKVKKLYVGVGDNANSAKAPDLNDPFGKILRNIKLAIQSLGNFRETDRLGEPCIVPLLCDPLEHLPLMEWDHLQIELAGMVQGTEKIPELLAKLDPAPRGNGRKYKPPYTGPCRENCPVCGGSGNWFKAVTLAQ